MKTTLKQQIAAVRDIKNEEEDRFLDCKEHLALKIQAKIQSRIDALNDAASVIASVEFIGIEEITHVQELIRCSKIICGKLNAIENVSAFADLVSVLRKMGHGKVKAKIVTKVVECDIHHAMSHNYKIVG